MWPRVALTVFLAGCGADATSTHLALATGRVHEVVLTQNPWVDDGLVAGEAALGAWAFERRLRSRHPRLATTLELSLGAFRFGLAVRNVRQGRAR